MLPSDPWIQLAREWLDRAESDRRLARLAVGDPSLSGLTAFHCQPAAEKALKAFLARRNQPFRRTHDLPALLVQCEAIDPALAALRHAASTLDDYLTAGRYPDTGPAPSPAEADQALQLAEEVMALARSRLPPEARP